MQPDYNNDFDFQEKLRALAAGELPVSEREALKKTLQQSTTAANEALFSQKLALALKHRDVLNANALIGAAIAEEEAMNPLPKPSIFGTWKTWMLGLVLVGIIGIGGYAALEMGWIDLSANSRLANRYLVPLENVLITSDIRSSLAELDQGMAAYDQGDYQQAVVLLGRYYQRTKDVNAGLFLGVSHLMLDDELAAIAVLETCAAQAEYPALEAINWYLALAFLKDGQTDRARSLLERIPKDGIYGTQAIKLLNEWPR
ncbi:MAG: tetratricopeptide repeat protein [Saprospiraceae bacterium]